MAKIKQNDRNVDKRDIPIDDEVLKNIADAPTGGSGVGDYITGRIQSMARELLRYRANQTKGKE